MENNKVKLSPVLHLLFIVCGIALMLAGATLIILKPFGFPYLFEGVMAFFVGGIAIYVAKFQMMMFEAIDGFTNIISGIAKKASQAPPMFGGGMMNPNNTMRIEIDENTSPEELEALKEKFPFMAGVIESMTKTFHKKDLSSMSLIQLERELREAIDSDNYEKAAVLRDLINKKKNK